MTDHEAKRIWYQILEQLRDLEANGFRMSDQDYIYRLKLGGIYEWYINKLRQHKLKRILK